MLQKISPHLTKEYYLSICLIYPWQPIMYAAKHLCNLLIIFLTPTVCALGSSSTSTNKVNLNCPAIAGLKTAISYPTKRSVEIPDLSLHSKPSCFLPLERNKTMKNGSNKAHGTLEHPSCLLLTGLLKSKL